MLAGQGSRARQAEGDICGRGRGARQPNQTSPRCEGRRTGILDCLRVSLWAFSCLGQRRKKASSFRCHGHRTIRARVSVEQSARFGWERYVGIDGAPIGMRIFGELAPFAEAREEIWLYGRRCRFRCHRATKIAQSDNTISPNLRRPARKGPRPLNWCHYAVRLPRKGNVADRAIARFARAYADRTETDHQALQQAVKSGRIPAEHGV
jgi:hypothetical protein